MMELLVEESAQFLNISPLKNEQDSKGNMKQRVYLEVNTDLKTCMAKQSVFEAQRTSFKLSFIVT